MPTILHLITGLGSGGAERMLTRLVTRESACDVRHHVVCLTDEGLHVHGPTIQKAGVRVDCLHMQRGRPSLAAVLRLVRLMREARPDILMTWLYHADLLGTIAAPFGGIRRLIWNVRCSNMDFARYARSTRWTAALLSKLSSRPWAIGVNSHAGRTAHESLGYAPRRWIYLPNGLDLDEWRPDAADRAAVRQQLGLGEQEVAVVMVARVDPMKDHATLLKAAAQVGLRHPTTRFFLIGRGTDTLELPQSLKDAVSTLGERTDVARLLRGMDVGVLSSSFGEGFPNALAEAMSTGLPCVTTDVGDAAELIGDTGKVVKARQPEALAAALDALIAEGPERLAHRGRDARARIADRWSIDRSAEFYDQLWKAALSR